MVPSILTLKRWVGTPVLRVHGYGSRLYLITSKWEKHLENFPSVKKELAIQVLQMAEKSMTSEKILDENFA